MYQLKIFSYLFKTVRNQDIIKRYKNPEATKQGGHRTVH